MATIDLPEEGPDYHERLIYKWSSRGRLDWRLKIWSRRPKRLFVKLGAIAGLVFGLLLGAGVAHVLGWI